MDLDSNFKVPDDDLCLITVRDVRNAIDSIDIVEIRHAVKIRPAESTMMRRLQISMNRFPAIHASEATRKKGLLKMSSEDILMLELSMVTRKKVK